MAGQGLNSDPARGERIPPVEATACGIPLARPLVKLPANAAAAVPSGHTRHRGRGRRRGAEGQRGRGSIPTGQLPGRILAPRTATAPSISLAGCRHWQRPAFRVAVVGRGVLPPVACRAFVGSRSPAMAFRPGTASVFGTGSRWGGGRPRTEMTPGAVRGSGARGPAQDHPVRTAREVTAMVRSYSENPQTEEQCRKLARA
jgi:hypothetical protein